MVSGLFNWIPATIEDQQNLWMLLCLAAPLLIVHAMKERLGNLHLVPNLSLVPRIAIYFAMLVAILTVGSFGNREFIYFQF